MNNNVDLNGDCLEMSKAVLGEIGKVLCQVEPAEVDVLVAEIFKAEKVFVIAVGRVFLAMQCFCKRLAHLGVDANVVGAINEAAMTPNDLLLVASGSGESIVPLSIARKAIKLGGRVGVITSATTSTIKSLSNFVVHLPCPTKNDMNRGVKSIQPMSTLFDQCLHIFGDIVAMKMLQTKTLTHEELWRFHANLE